MTSWARSRVRWLCRDDRARRDALTSGCAVSKSPAKAKRLCVIAALVQRLIIVTALPSSSILWFQAWFARRPLRDDYCAP
ncbi:MAG TPA: hypothetical protein VEF04_16955, partial [Blastocatellia bacterium]|nr:hypothetical protein [Blastocatellia bacterium]